MRIETDRLIIRSVERGDEMVYADMAKDILQFICHMLERRDVLQIWRIHWH